MTTPPPPPPAAPPPPPMGGPPPPPGYANNEEKTWALVAHFGGGAGMLVSGILGWVAPLIAYVAKGNESPTVRAHAVNALNFQITWSIVGLVGYLTICVVIGGLILPAAIVVSIIFSIIAGIKANEGELYTYKASLKLIK